MNIPDLINDFLVDVREHDGFANDKNFDRVAAEVFKQKIKEVIELCANIVAGEASLCSKGDETGHIKGGYIGLHDAWQRIRALAAPGESENRNKCIMLGCDQYVADPEPFSVYCLDHKPSATPGEERKGIER